MLLTVAQTIQVAKISQGLAVKDIAKRGLSAGGQIINLPRKIYMIRKNVEWLYDLSPSDDSLTGMANFLYALCAPYNLVALNMINSGGSVSPVVPGGDIYPFVIRSADFEADGKTYNNPDIEGDTIMLFINEWTQQYLFAPISFTMTATGFVINNGVGEAMQGFDASLYDYTIVIYKVNNG